ncbi:MAG TPA: hypothetical protein VJP02_17845 [Candidatus Sulfotelmatobacter sp.]|nr:hypothetical protein [Candidatus Sulfotelmatobacter sp.]
MTIPFKHPPVDGEVGDIPENIREFLDEQVAGGWEIVRDAAETVLREDPHNVDALDDLKAYQEFRGRGKTIYATSRKSRTGVWKQHADGSYCISVAKSEVGDEVNVRRANGREQRYRLTERIEKNLFRGVGI